MTPVALLAGFCAIMAAIAVFRLALTDDREAVEAGTALLAVAIAALSIAWATVVAGWIGAPVLIAGGLAIVGLTVGCAGAVLIARGW